MLIHEVQLYFSREMRVGGRGGYSNIHVFNVKKSRIQETKNLSTDADSMTDTILERFRDLSHFNLLFFSFFLEVNRGY